MSRPKARILIVDDEPAMLEACEETLRYHGYDVSLRDTPTAASPLFVNRHSI